jgi:hypothetical protein
LAGNFDETVDGDLSGNPAVPTSLGTLSLGANALSATFGGGDFDLLTFAIAPGQQLNSITLNSYSGRALSFSGLQGGTVWTAGLGGAVDPTNLLGWTHISGGVVGTDILDDYGLGSGALGFTPPLPAGNYTLEIQDTGGAVSASLTFNVVPEPSGVALTAIGLIGLAASGWRRKRQSH